MATPIPPTLGKQVTYRTFSWLAMVEQAWGGSYRRPDHNIYRFSDGRGFDSTDSYSTGFYRNGISQSWRVDNPGRLDVGANVDQMNQPETW